MECKKKQRLKRILHVEQLNLCTAGWLLVVRVIVATRSKAPQIDHVNDVLAVE